jgi:crotonobetaine/carnitine-CoA ligase
MIDLDRINSINDLLKERVRRSSEQLFLTSIDENRSWTYGEFARQVARFATALAALGIKRGDAVALILANHADFLFASFAIRAIGAVEVSINLEFRDAVLRRCILVSGTRLILVDLEHVGQLRSAFDGTDCPSYRLVGADSDVEHPDHLLAGMDSSTPDYLPVSLNDDDPLAIYFTSGSTGLPKACRVTHRWAFEIIRSSQEFLTLGEYDCVLTPYPLFHVGAAIYDVLPPLVAGGRVVIRRKFSLNAWHDNMIDHRVTIFPVLGSVGSLLWNMPPDARDSALFLRAFSGGPLPVDRDVFGRRFGALVADGYATTEMGFVAALSPGAHASNGCVGRVRPGYNLEIVDDDGQPLPIGQSGEIRVRALKAHLMFDGYLADTGPQSPLDADGWFRPGDVGRLDAEGWLFFVGRTGGRIRRRGHNISAVMIEDVVAQCPGVELAIVVGVPSDAGEEDLVAVVQSSLGAELVPMVTRWCAERLDRTVRPDHVLVAAVLPMTPTLKVVRAEVQRLAVHTLSLKRTILEVDQADDPS